MDHHTSLLCPNCGATASAVVRRSAGGLTVIDDYRCPNGCQVDQESLRQIVSTSDN